MTVCNLWILASINFTSDEDFKYLVEEFGSKKVEEFGSKNLELLK